MDHDKEPLNGRLPWTPVFLDLQTIDFASYHLEYFRSLFDPRRGPIAEGIVFSSGYIHRKPRGSALPSESPLARTLSPYGIHSKTAGLSIDALVLQDRVAPHVESARHPLCNHWSTRHQISPSCNHEVWGIVP